VLKKSSFFSSLYTFSPENWPKKSTGSLVLGCSTGLDSSFISFFSFGGSYFLITGSETSYFTGSGYFNKTFFSSFFLIF